MHNIKGYLPLADLNLFCYAFLLSSCATFVNCYVSFLFVNLFRFGTLSTIIFQVYKYCTLHCFTFELSL